MVRVIGMSRLPPGRLVVAIQRPFSGLAGIAVRASRFRIAGEDVFQWEAEGEAPESQAFDRPLASAFATAPASGVPASAMRLQRVHGPNRARRGAAFRF